MTKGYEGVKRWTKQVRSFSLWNGTCFFMRQTNRLLVHVRGRAWGIDCVHVHIGGFVLQEHSFGAGPPGSALVSRYSWRGVKEDLPLWLSRECTGESWKGNSNNLTFLVVLLANVLSKFWLFVWFVFLLIEHPEILDNWSEGEASKRLSKWLDGVIWRGLLNVLV